MKEASDALPEKISVPDREKEILKYWKEHDIFQKTLEQTKGGEPYVFYDGPPFATGMPHYGHLLPGTTKDVIPRYQTMRGRFVRRVWGWDCHGLPIENLVEKELGFKTKKEIEEYGIAKFNAKAEESVLEFEKEWKEIIPRMGRFVDMDHPYMTMGASYTESIWWAFKTLYDKKLIEEGYKSMHICPRCETTLAASEVAQGYKDVKDISVYVQFRLVDEPNTYFLAWTTTPWTLPGNVALAVGADIRYSKFRLPDSKNIYIVATDRLAALPGEKMIFGEVKGKDLAGKSYVPVFDYYAKDKKLPNRENGWKIYAADFVTTESGTGIVHIAPAFGEDDMNLGKEKRTPFVQHVGMDGKMRPEVTDFAGRFVKPKSDDDKERLATDIAVIQYLKEHGAFFAKENITHAYPHCWRCDWPLLNYAASSWFVMVTALRERIIAANARVAWIPEHVGTGRFGKWLEGARDWAISRSRYWGAPIPVWKCNKCGNVEALGSLEELRARTTRKNRYLLMRHGEAENNVTDTVSYSLKDSYHLTEKGKREVAEAMKFLKKAQLDYVVASPVLRTQETAKLVAEALGISADRILTDPRIAEANTGIFNGKPIAEYRAYFADVEEKFTKRPPEGETLEEMKARLGGFLYDIDGAYEGKTILIVTHEYCAWLLEAVANGMTNHEAAVLRDGEGEDFIANAECRELRFAAIPHNERYELDLHRPYADDVRWHCTCELGTMERVPEVFDCWFESGSMPFAQFHYLGDDKTPEGKLFRSQYPAQMIAESLDQTRGWFYTMLILGVGLFGASPYESVVVSGLVLAEDGQKMSKRLKNYPDLMDVVSRYGADALRFYLMSSPAVRGEELRLAETGIDDVFKKIILRVGNVLSFIEFYGKGRTVSRKAPESTDILDRWVIARFREMLTETTRCLEMHEIDSAARLIPKFVDDLSTWYLRRSRERLKSDDPTDAEAAYATLLWTLCSFARVIAPFMPFLAEDIYRRLDIADKKESVHLEAWPSSAETATGGDSSGEAQLLADMAKARAIVTAGLEARAKSGIKVRQPLRSLAAPALPPALAAIVADEVNVKEVVFGESVTLDTTITPELRAEGDLRDMIRLTQDERKKRGLVPSDNVDVVLTAPAMNLAAVKKHEAEFRKAVNASTVTLHEGELAVLVTTQS